jgi:hypothetical protein
MRATPETPSTLLLFCRNPKIDDQRSPEEREDHTNQRLLKEKCINSLAPFVRTTTFLQNQNLLWW